MSDTPPAVIPIDVYGLIIDSIAEDNEGLTTMRACSLVSRSFLVLARKHIFASVDINNPNATEDCPSPTIDAFVRLIEGNPEIGEYVRKIDYCIAAHDHIMSPILRTLGKLTKLNSLSIWHHSEEQLKWRTQKWHNILLSEIDVLNLEMLKTGAMDEVGDGEILNPTQLEIAQRRELHEMEKCWTKGLFLSTALPRKSVRLHEYTAGLQSASATKKLSKAKSPDGLPIVDFTELVKITADCDTKEDIDAIQSILIQTEQLQNIDLTISEFLTFTELADMVIPSIRTLKGVK